MTYNGRELSDKKLIDWLAEIQDLGAGEIMLTSIDQEGTCSGFDIKLLSKYRQFINTPLICSGGIANQMHITSCFSEGADAVAIAAAFHFEKISINQIKESLIDNRVKIRL